MSPRLKKLEKEFYEKRTKGEPLVNISWSQDGSEKTRKDHFLSEYMGKEEYDDGSFELASMGVQMLYTEPRELAKDPDYLKFVLGIVALI